MLTNLDVGGRRVNQCALNEQPPTFHSKRTYCRPQLFCIGHALKLIRERADCKSKLVAERVRRMIDESGGSLSFSPSGECRRLQISLSLVSRQFKKLYQVTMRSYARQVRMKAAEKLLKESKNLNIDETARLFGYSFTSAFSRCFRQTFGRRPKRYQMQQWITAPPWKTGGPNNVRQDSQLLES